MSKTCFKNWDPVNIKTESEWRSRARKIMRANLLFCCIVLIALVFEYRAYVNREQETDQNLEISIKNLLRSLM